MAPKRPRARDSFIQLPDETFFCAPCGAKVAAEGNLAKHLKSEKHLHAVAEVERGRALYPAPNTHAPGPHLDVAIQRAMSVGGTHALALRSPSPDGIELPGGGADAGSDQHEGSPPQPSGPLPVGVETQGTLGVPPAELLQSLQQRQLPPDPDQVPSGIEVNTGNLDVDGHTEASDEESVCDYSLRIA